MDPSITPREGTPLYLRKLNRQWEWTVPADGEPPANIDELANASYESAFRDDEGRISVFRVTSETDVRRVLLAMNGTPPRSLHEKILVVAFTDAMLNQFQIGIEQEPGDTRCTAANALHRNLIDDREKITELIKSCLQARHNSAKVNKPEMKAIEAAAIIGKCRVVTSEGACDCCASSS